MADNTQISPASSTTGDVIATDDIGGVKYQRVKLAQGADGSATDVSAAAPLQVSLANHGANATAVKVDGSAVTQPVSDAGGSLTVDGTVTANLAAGTNNIGDVDVLTINGSAPAFGTGTRSTSVLRVTVATDDVVPVSDNGGNLSIDDGGNSITVDDGAGSLTVDFSGQQTQDYDSGAGTATQLTVGLVFPASGGPVAAPGDATYGLKVNISTSVTLQTQAQGTVAHDGVDSGNPIKVGGRAETTFQAAASDGDRVDWQFDVYGVANVRNDHPNKWSFHYDGSTALSSQVIAAAPGAGLSNYITDVAFSLGSSAASNNVRFKETSTTILGPYYLENVVGRSIHLRFSTPKKCTANVDLLGFTGSSAVHTLDVHGFIAP